MKLPKIEIPEKFADIIESAENTRSGQTRRYGPYEEVFDVVLKKEYDEKDRDRILEFCQECLHKCKYSEEQLLEIKRSRDRSFDDLMSAIATGSYTLRCDFANKKEVVYKWSQDYLD